MQPLTLERQQVSCWLHASAMIIPPRRRFAPSLVAAFAALLGMGSCRAALVVMWAHNPYSQNRTINTLIFLSPFILGALVVGVAYAVLRRWDATMANWIRGAPTDVTRDDRSGKRAPLTVFLVITGLGAAINATLAGLFAYFGGDSGPPSSTQEAATNAVSGVIGGGLVGAVFGLLLGVPAAAIIWLFDRRSRQGRSTAGADDT
jgi:hypothetical protein